MKVRWMEGSIRLRITPSELAALQRGEAVQETLTVLGGGWTAAIVPTEGETDIGMEAGILSLRLSSTELECLADPQEEGVYLQQAGETPLAYYVEKDFPCEHPRPSQTAEESRGTFSRPAS